MADIIARAMAGRLTNKEGNLDTSKIIFNTDKTTAYSIGGIPQGYSLQGKTYEEILTLLLMGVMEPELTSPTLTVILNKTAGTPGKAFQTQGTMIFNRGSITPAYGTSGFRAGLPNTYAYGSAVEQSQNLQITFTLTIDNLLEGDNLVVFEVAYDAGEQPKNSLGENFSSALSSGSIQQTITITGILPVYKVDQDGQLSEQDTSISYFEEDNGDYGYQLDFPAESDTEAESQQIAIPAEKNVVGVQIYDVLTDSWQWLGGDEETSLSIFKKAADITVNEEGLEIIYSIYASDVTMEYHPLGERQLRFVLSDEV